MAMRIASYLLNKLGIGIAQYLSRRVHTIGAAPPIPTDLLRGALQPGDVLLVEGLSRISTAIKYLTQSTWSHAALYVGDELRKQGAHPSHCFVEVDLVEGVRSTDLEAFAGMHTRICRPVGLTESALADVLRFAINHLGLGYDLRNVIDLARYLWPMPPVPSRLRRRMLALGSGDPTRAICSTLIAQAFQAVHYPVLPEMSQIRIAVPEAPDCIAEVLHIRHYSLYTPRDFDVSPYFAIVKPTLTYGFNYRALRWGRDSARDQTGE